MYGLLTYLFIEYLRTCLAIDYLPVCLRIDTYLLVYV